MFVGIDVYIWMAPSRKERRKGAEGKKMKKGGKRKEGKEGGMEEGREEGKEERRKGRKGKGCPNLLSAAVINTTITTSLRRKVFISLYSPSWREAKERVQTGTWRQEQRNQRGILLTNSLGPSYYTF